MSTEKRKRYEEKEGEEGENEYIKKQIYNSMYC